MPTKPSPKPFNNSTQKIPLDDKRTEIISDALLYSREQACRILGVSRPTLVRLEAAGKLPSVRLNPDKPTAKIFYRRRDLLSLIEG